MVGLILLLAVLTLAYFFFTYHFSYWKTRGIKYLKPYPLVGSMGKVFAQKQHMLEFFYGAYRQAKDDPYIGYFSGRKPALVIKDLDLLKSILIKDFTHFVDHGLKIDEEIDPVQGKTLSNLDGQRWKDMRSKISPTFTSGRMKAMFPLVVEVAEIFEKYVGELADANADIDVKDLLSRYTTDVISSCAFGVICDSINNPQAHFRNMGRKMHEITVGQALKNVIIAFLPEIAKKLKLQFFDDTVSEFFHSLVSDVISLRKKTGETRNDFMQLMIQLKEKGVLTPEDDDNENVQHFESTNTTKLTDDDVAAQALSFFFAGFETSSSALNITLFEMARRPDLQNKIREEVEEVLAKHDGKLTYQAIQDMKYLDMVLQETLRKYPPVSILTRKCTKTYVIPGTKTVIEKGTILAIPVNALQNDSKYYPAAHIYNPDRFYDEKQKTTFAYMPFGEGPRTCIGLRFAQMQIKVGLLTMMRKFNLELSPNGPEKLIFDPRRLLLKPLDHVLIRAHRI